MISQVIKYKLFCFHQEVNSDLNESIKMGLPYIIFQLVWYGRSLEGLSFGITRISFRGLKVRNMCFLNSTFCSEKYINFSIIMILDEGGCATFSSRPCN